MGKRVAFTETLEAVRAEISLHPGVGITALARQLCTDRRRVKLALRLLKAERMGFISSCVLQTLLRNGASLKLLEDEVGFTEGYHRGVS